MGDIILSSSVRSNLLSLQGTADLLGKTQERLSTGLKVNSALDDPASFFTASALNNRAGDLNRLLDSVGLPFRPWRLRMPASVRSPIWSKALRRLLVRPCRMVRQRLGSKVLRR